MLGTSLAHNAFEKCQFSKTKPAFDVESPGAVSIFWKRKLFPSLPAPPLSNYRSLHYHSVEQSQEISALNISNFFLDSGALWSSANSASGKVRHLSPLANNPDISCTADRFIISRAIWQSRVESCTEEVHLHRGMPPTLTLGGSEWIKLTTTEALCQTLPA